MLHMYGGPEGQSSRTRLRLKSSVLRVTSQVEVLGPQGQVSGRSPRDRCDGPHGQVSGRSPQSSGSFRHAILKR